MSTQLIEKFIPPIQSDGLNTNTPVAFGSTLAVTGATTLASTLAVTGAATFSGGVNSTKPVITVTSGTTTLTAAQSGSLVLLNGATGCGVVLPVPTAGMSFEVLAIASVASSSYLVRTDSSSTFLSGGLYNAVNASTTSALVTGNGTSSVKISMNGSTTGGLLGTKIVLLATSTAVWNMAGNNIGSGTMTTPIG